MPHNYGYQLRVRHVYFDNAVDLDSQKDDRNHFLRVRSGLWGRVGIRSHLEIFGRLNNEFRRYVHPEVDFEVDEVIFENLYLKWTEVAGLPVDLTVGRQDIFLGEGFLVADGGPLDGSRTYYHNGIRVTLHMASGQIDVLAISNPRRDEYLPVLNNQHRNLVESDERLLGLHMASARLRGTEFQPYYFYKEEDPSPRSSHRLNLHTAGLRLTRELSGSARFTGEFAFQDGDRCGQTVTARGGYAYLETSTGYRGLNIAFGGMYLSGSDDAPCNGWNPLLSRWPKWSELYIYTLIPECGVAYWQNVSAGFLWFTQPVGRSGSFSFRYYYLGAPEKRVRSRTGSLRGVNVQGEIRFRLHPKVTGHLLAEKFMPESFYSSGPEPEKFDYLNRSDALFLRWQLLFDL